MTHLGFQPPGVRVVGVEVIMRVTSAALRSYRNSNPNHETATTSTVLGLVAEARVLQGSLVEILTGRRETPGEKFHLHSGGLFVTYRGHVITFMLLRDTPREIPDTFRPGEPLGGPRPDFQVRSLKIRGFLQKVAGGRGEAKQLIARSHRIGYSTDVRSWTETIYLRDPQTGINTRVDIPRRARAEARVAL
jgi:hypothetical protein